MAAVVRDDTVSGAGDTSLLQFLDLSQINCLNEAQNHTLRSIVAKKTLNSGPTYLLSDADEQLLLNIYFNQAVRVRSIVFKSNIAEQGPKTIKLVVNRPALGFEDVEDAEEPEAAQILHLSEEDVRKGNRVSLRYVRFQYVNSLHIFVADNLGENDETRVDALDIYGVPVETTRDLSGLKQQNE